MSHMYVHALLFLGVPVSGQIIESLFSDAASIYGDLTSILGVPSDGTSSDGGYSTPSTTNDQSTTSSDFYSFTTSSSSSSETTSSASTTQTSSRRPTPSSTHFSSTSTTSASAGAASAGNSGSSNVHGNNKLGIILGCVLGILAIALLLLLCFCLRRRRRRRYISDYERRSSGSRFGRWGRWKRRSSYSSSRSSSPKGVTGVHSFEKRGEPVAYPVSHQANTATNTPTAFGAMAAVPKRKPVPGTIAPQEKAALEKEVFYPNNDASYVPKPAYDNHGAHKSHMGSKVAAGVGGVAAGGLAAAALKRHHDNKNSTLHSPDVKHGGIVDPAATVSSSDPPSDAYQTADSSPAPTSPLGAVLAGGRHNSGNFYSRDGPYDTGHNGVASPVPHQTSNKSSTVPAGAVGAVGGAAAVAALARSRRNSSKSPHRKSWSAKTTDVHPAFRTSNELQRPVSLPNDVPPAPPIPERRDRPLGTGAPAAAAGSYLSESIHPSRQRRVSIGGPPPLATEPVPPLPSYTEYPPMPNPYSPEASAQLRQSAPDLAGATMMGATAAGINRPHQNQKLNSEQTWHTTPQNQPNYYQTPMSPVSPLEGSAFATMPRQPGRTMRMPQHFGSSNNRFDQSAHQNELTRPNQGSGLVSAVSSVFGAHQDSAIEDDPGQNPGGKAIVGDNGYPHHNIPRRKSGGEYDYTEHGPFGPPSVGPSRRSTSRTRTGLSASVISGSEQPERSSSDDSTIRLSSAMPGGWTHPPPPPIPPSRRSGEVGRYYPPRSLDNGNPRRHSRSSSKSSSRAITPSGSRPSSIAPDGGSVNRVRSRPGYGVGSGDPYDLAANRTSSANSLAGFKLQRSRSNSRPRQTHESPEARYERLSRELDDSEIDVPFDEHNFSVGRAY